MKNNKIHTFILICLIAVGLISCSPDSNDSSDSRPNANRTQSKTWEVIAETNNGTFYIDTASIKKNGHYVTVWRLIDYQIPPEFEGKKLYSGEIFEQYDCSGMVVNQIKIIAYSGKMADGVVIQKFEKLNRVISIDAGTPIERVFAYLCK